MTRKLDIHGSHIIGIERIESARPNGKFIEIITESIGKLCPCRDGIRTTGEEGEAFLVPLLDTLLHLQIRRYSILCNHIYHAAGRVDT